MWTSPRKTGADGVHVGQEDLAAGRARELLGPDRLIGVSAHSVEEALAAQAAGADYLGVGAAFVTGTKTDATPITRETIRAITAAVDIPVVAIGGISRRQHPGAGGLRPGRRGGGLRPVRPGRCEGRGGGAQSPLRPDRPVTGVPGGGSGAPPSAALENFNAILSDRKEASI